MKSIPFRTCVLLALAMQLYFTLLGLHFEWPNTGIVLGVAFSGIIQTINYKLYIKERRETYNQ